MNENNNGSDDNHNMNLGAIKELIKHIVEKTVETEDVDYVGKMDFHKILYLLKDRLDESNQLYNLLPFHWYKHGPYSQVATHAVKELEDDSVISSTDEGEGEGYTIGDNEFKFSEENKDLREAKEELIIILDEFNFLEKRDRLLNEEIYPDAPYDFQRHFRFECVPSFEKFKDNYSSYSARTAHSLFKRKMTMAEAMLPLENEFEDFNRVFSRLVTLTDRYFEGIEELKKEDAEQLEDLTSKAWDLFAKKLRIHTSDDMSNRFQEQWIKDYKEEKKEFESRLKHFESEVLKKLGKKGLPEFNKPSEDSGWGIIAKELLESGGDVIA